MSELPRVSIVTPSYNQVTYLETTIRSVLAQDYPALEYFIIDGGSTDGSADIINKYSEKLTWWISEPDSGQAEAINKGLSRASGEIVAWLNSDDLYLPEAIKGAVAAFQAHPQGSLVYGNAISIDTHGRPLHFWTFPDWGWEQLMSYRIICQPSVFIRRSVLDKVGLLDTSYHFMLDHNLWMRIVLHGEVFHIPELWAAARYHPRAKNVAQAPEFGREAFRLWEWMQAQPQLEPWIKQNQRQIQAGLHRLNGRYLLDGGLPAEALRSYWKSFSMNPGYTLQHWQRILFAVFSLFSSETLSGWLAQQGRKLRPTLKLGPELAGWPGICMEK